MQVYTGKRILSRLSEKLHETFFFPDMHIHTSRGYDKETALAYSCNMYKKALAWSIFRVIKMTYN